MDKSFYFDQLYPLQDEVLRLLGGVDTGFYLTGGTAASRGYLHDREEPKDLADIWGFCGRMGLTLSAALQGAQSKAAGIFPADVARLLCTVDRKDWELVRWIDPPDPDQFIEDLRWLGEGLILP